MVVVAVVAGVITATRSSGRKTSSAPTIPVAPSTSVPQRGPPSASTDPNQSALQQLAVGPSDVGSGLSTGLITGGNQVVGETTLDLCNGTFASEDLRTARRQTAVADSSGDIVFSTEAVLYQSPNGTAEAFTELRSTATGCPPTFVQSPVGETAVKTTFNPAPDGSWPATPTVERLAYDFTTTDQQGQSQHEVTVFLRRGRALLGLYFSQPPPTPPTIDGQTTIPGIVTDFASRLAKLPAAAVDRTFIPANATVAP
jgi:hypothetical protein